MTPERVQVALDLIREWTGKYLLAAETAAEIRELSLQCRTILGGGGAGWNEDHATANRMLMIRKLRNITALAERIGSEDYSSPDANGETPA